MSNLKSAATSGTEFLPKKGAKAAKSAKKEPKAAKKPAKKAAKTKKTTTQKEYAASKGLSKLLKKEKVSRTEATKLIWDYIKEHNLQNPSDKRQIVPDEALSLALGEKKPFNMMKLAGLLSKQLTDE